MAGNNPFAAAAANPDTPGTEDELPTVSYNPPEGDQEEPTVSYQRTEPMGKGELVPHTASPEFTQATGLDPQKYDQFREYLAKRESQSYDEAPISTGSATTPSVSGRYQMGPEEIRDAAKRLGIPNPSTDQYLHDPGLQEQLFENYTLDHHNTLMKYGPYANGTPEERAAMLAGAHLGGPGAIMSGNDPRDKFGTHVSNYVHGMYNAMVDGSSSAGQQYAQAASQTMTDATSTVPPAGAPVPDLGRAQMRAAAIQEAGIRADPRLAPAPDATSTAPPPGTTAYYQQRAALLAQPSPLQAYGMPPEGPTVMQQISHMASYLPPAFASGFADFMDLPVHMINGFMRYSANHPDMGLDDPNAQAAMQQMKQQEQGIQSFDPNGHSLVTGLPSSPNTPFAPPQVPGEGAAQAALPGAMKALGIDARSPNARGDTSLGAQAVWDIGTSLGQAGPFQFVGAGRALATAGVRAGLTALGKDAVLTGVFPGMGEMLGNELVGPAAEPVGQIMGGVIGAKMATFRSGMEAMVFSPAAEAAQENAPGVLSKAVGSFGPKAVANAAADDFAGALARVQALRETPGATSSAAGLTGEAKLVEGFTTPAYALSGDPGLRTLAHYIHQNDPEAFKAVRDVVDNNMQAIQKSLGVDTAQIDQAKNAIGDYAALRDLNTQQMLAQAQERARLDAEAATAGTSPGSVSEKANRSAATMEQLLRVDQDRRSLANADFDAARQSGAMNATVGPPSTTYNAAYNLLSEYRRLHLESSIPTEATDLLFGPGSRPEQLFDRDGSRLPANEGAAVEHQYGPSTTLEQQQALVSQLSNIQGNAAALIRTGSAGADPQSVRFLSKLGTAARQDFEAGLNASGNPAIVRNALNNWDEYRSTFRQGIIGRVLGHDASGEPRVSPEAALDTVLKSGTQGVANTRALLDTLGAPDPITGMMRNPATELRDKMVGFLRQDFANSTNQGQKAMESWARNHEEILSGLPGPAGQPFRALSNEVNQAISSGQDALDFAKKPSEAAGDAVTLFLKGNPGGELDKALSGPNRGKSMNNLLAAVQEDPTGNATRGVAGMVMDRIFAAGAKPNPAGGWDLNPSAARLWHDTNKDALNAMDKVLPGFSGRAEQVTNSLQRVAEIQANPGKPLSARQVENFASMNGIGRLGFRMIGASAGEKLGNLMPSGMGGRLQHAAIGAEAGQQLYDATFSRLSRGTAAATLREAMMDPTLFAKLDAPWKSVQAAQEASGAIAQLLDRLPRGYLVSTGVNLTTPTKIDPEPPKGRTPNLQQLGMPPQSTALPTMGIGQTTAPGQLPGQPASPTLVPGGRALQ